MSISRNGAKALAEIALTNPNGAEAASQLRESAKAKNIDVNKLANGMTSAMSNHCNQGDEQAYKEKVQAKQGVEARQDQQNKNTHRPR